MPEAESRPQARVSRIHLTDNPLPGQESQLSQYRKAAQKSGCKFKIEGKPGDSYDFNAYYAERDHSDHPVRKGVLGPHSYILAVTGVPGVREGAKGSLTKFEKDLDEIVRKDPLYTEQ